MPDTEMNTPADAGTVSKDFADMPQGDIDFIMTCIQNATDGALTVDSAKIASKMGYVNPRSVSNRIGQIKKKYGLAIKAGTGKATADADGTVTTPATKTPRTPNKVTKTPKTPRTKATPTPTKGKKAPAKITAEADVDMADAEGNEEGGASLTVKDDTDDAVLETPTKPKKTSVKRTPAAKKVPTVKKSPAAKKAVAKKEVKSEEKVKDEDEDADMEEGSADLSVKATGEEVKSEGVAE
ncbi:hypothetical protein BDZ45DRAFT_745610 [Acephala macrosclerotiorum]|nr:hypothetical protein BDZ45DRAFT_745610 [Acephala macrosclerotiorum]